MNAHGALILVYVAVLLLSLATTAAAVYLRDLSKKIDRLVEPPPLPGETTLDELLDANEEREPR